MKPERTFVRVVLTSALLALALLATRPASAHLANFGSWEVTRDYLGELFEGADRFLAKKHQFTDTQVERIEATLGFELYPEDREPTFYVAVDEDHGRKKFLGVAMFIDPRVEPKVLEGRPLRLEVGIAVDPQGKVAAVRVFDYRGDLTLTKPKFLSQFHGMKLGDEFTMDDNEELTPVDGQEQESQLIANAVHEALYLMKISLGKSSR